MWQNGKNAGPQFGNVAFGCFYVKGDAKVGYITEYFAHELGHIFGRRHPRSFSGNGGSEENAYCKPRIPFFEQMQNVPNVDGPVWVSTIGPFEPPGERMYGWDSNLEQVLHPERSFELMSYCRHCGKRTILIK